MTREFTIQKAQRKAVPLIVGLYGPSGSGKTWSSLALATGMQKIVGGRIALIDTEGGRGLHYADHFDFDHVPFGEPFGSLAYLEAIQFAASKASVVIVDSMSHEHESAGGMLDFQEREVERMSQGDSAKAERVKMLAWQKPKAARRALLRGIVSVGTDAILILCFRAKNTSKPAKDANGKTTVVQMGFMPIAGDEFVYEASIACFLPPASDGHPNWRPENPGEQTMMKLPAQFRPLLLNRAEPLDESVGRSLAEWARGDIARQPAAAPRATVSPGSSDPLPGDSPSPSSAAGDPGDSLHAEALEAVRSELRARGVKRFAEIALLAKDAGIDALRVAACWDGREKAIHLERLTLDELTMVVDHMERTAGDEPPLPDEPGLPL